MQVAKIIIPSQFTPDQANNLRLELDGKIYLLLLPENAPIEIFAWDEDDEVTELVSVEDEEEIDRIFADANAVLSEQNLTLKRTAFTLSASGEYHHSIRPK